MALLKSLTFHIHDQLTAGGLFGRELGIHRVYQFSWASRFGLTPNGRLRGLTHL